MGIDSKMMNALYQEAVKEIEDRTKDACFEVAWPILLGASVKMGLYEALKRELKQAIKSVEIDHGD